MHKHCSPTHTHNVHKRAHTHATDSLCADTMLVEVRSKVMLRNS